MFTQFLIVANVLCALAGVLTGNWPGAALNGVIAVWLATMD